MHTVWKRIEDWLTLHAPELGALLEPGATDQEFQEAQALLGVVFPEEIKGSYRIHNGVRFSPLSSDFIAGKFALFSLREMIETWKEWNDKEAYIIDYSEGDSEDDWRKDIKEIAERDGSDINLEGRDPKLVPFMNWPVGVYLCFDTAETVHGSFGQLIQTDSGPQYGLIYLAPGLHAFLSSFAENLEAGKYLVERQAGFTRLGESPPAPSER